MKISIFVVIVYFAPCPFLLMGYPYLSGPWSAHCLFSWLLCGLLMYTALASISPHGSPHGIFPTCWHLLPWTLPTLGTTALWETFADLVTAFDPAKLERGGGEGHRHHTGYQCYFITSPHLPCSAWPQGFAAVSGRSAKASFVGGFSGRPCHARLIQSKGEGQWASVCAGSGQSERGGNGWVLAGWKETAC